jgi:hypothetical protein
VRISQSQYIDCATGLANFQRVADRNIGEHGVEIVRDSEITLGELHVACEAGTLLVG